MIKFIQDTPKQRVFDYSSKEDEIKFRFYFQMGLITPIPEIWTKKQYKNFTIELVQHDYTGEWEYMFYPTEEGIQHDGEVDGGDWKYCGNCKWSSDIDDVMDLIDEAQPIDNPQKSIENYLKRVNK